LDFESYGSYQEALSRSAEVSSSLVFLPFGVFLRCRVICEKKQHKRWKNVYASTRSQTVDKVSCCETSRKYFSHKNKILLVGYSLLGVVDEANSRVYKLHQGKMFGFLAFLVCCGSISLCFSF
jgi:hypothetical protein